MQDGDIITLGTSLALVSSSSYVRRPTVLHVGIVAMQVSPEESTPKKPISTNSFHPPDTEGESEDEVFARPLQIKLLPPATQASIDDPPPIPAQEMASSVPVNAQLDSENPWLPSEARLNYIPVSYSELVDEQTDESDPANYHIPYGYNTEDKDPVIAEPQPPKSQTLQTEIPPLAVYAFINSLILGCTQRGLGCS